MRTLTATFAALSCSVACCTLLAVTGCGDTSTQVTRTDEKAVRDLSGNWNATDSNVVAEAMVDDCLKRPWADNFKTANNRLPVVKVGRIIVHSNGDVIDTEIFTNDLLRALVNSGKVKKVASNALNDQAREERKQQDVHASEATRKESFQETGADFILVGSIRVQDDQADGKKQKFYSIDLEMTDIKSQEQVWLGNKKIAKDVSRGSYK